MHIEYIPASVPRIKKIHMKKDMNILNRSWKGANRVNAATKKQTQRNKTGQTKKTQEQNVNPLRPNEGAFFFCPDSFLKRT